MSSVPVHLCRRCETDWVLGWLLHIGWRPLRCCISAFSDSYMSCSLTLLVIICVEGDSACSKKELGKLKWAYGITTSPLCKDVKAQTSTYKNVLCCRSNLCNAPDKKLDPATKVLPGELQLSGPSAPAGKKPK